MEKTRKCPYCGEEIMADARKCRHCGEWLNDNVELNEDPVRKLGKQEPENQQTNHPIVGSTPESPHVVYDNNTKSRRMLFIIISVILAVVLAITVACLFVGGEGKSTDKAVKKEIEKQVVEAYSKGSVYDILTQEFGESMNIAYELREFHVTSSYADYFSLLFDREIAIKEVKLVGKDNAEIHVSYGDEHPVFIMVREGKSLDNNNSKWLIDDVCSCFGLSSLKNSTLTCSNSIDWGNAMANWEDEIEGYSIGYEKESLSLHHFMGQIAGAKIHMSITVDGLMVQGRYYYDSKWAEGNKASLSLYGNCNGGHLRLTESVNNMVTGVFEGEWNDGIFEGTFTRANDGKGLSFRLIETEGGPGFFTEYDIVAE